MMRGPRNLLWMLPVTLAVTGPLWWGGAAVMLSPQSSDPAANRSRTEQRPQAFVMDDVLIKQHVDGVEVWDIRSKQASSFDSGETLLFEGIVADLYRDNEVLFHIVSNGGQHEQKKQSLELSGDVLVKHKKGGTLETQQLFYLEKTSRITTKTPVRMTGEGMEVRGEGFDYDLNTGAYMVSGRVKVEVK